MPKTHRDILRRRIAQVVNLTEISETYLLEVKAEFDPVHPELGEILQKTLETLELSIRLLEAFCTHSWGGYPADWDTWRNPSIHKSKNDGQ